MSEITLLILATVILAAGAVLGYFARQTIARKKAGTIEAKLAKLIEDAKREAKDILLRAKDKAVKVLEEVKKEERERQEHIRKMEERLGEREQSIEHQNQELQRKFQELKIKAQKIKKLSEEIEELRQKELANLEKIAKMTQGEAREELLSLAEKENEQVLKARLDKLAKDQKEELAKKAREIMILAMQRYAASQAAEVTTSTVSLPSDELKGRIIGKEGRNIKTLERLTGIEIIVDDTPEAIIISGFDPIRRQVAKVALEKLIADGRIQPARIEEAVEKAKGEISEKIQEAGEAAIYDTGIVGLESRLVRILGRLRFRTSYGQNILLHSIEVAHLAGGIAAELGANVSLAKKAGLLHDIGKAVDHEIQGSHVEIGKMILQKFNMPEEVIETMQSHHEEYPHANIEGAIIQVADALSGARPGARKDTLEAYLRRLEELEQIANTFSGVEKSYAIQAGREIRIFVQPEKISDLEAKKLARQIADRIQEELKYPGEIKVNVIREMRVVEYAR